MFVVSVTLYATGACPPCLFCLVNVFSSESVTSSPSCCKGHPSSQWEQPILGVRPQKTIGAIKIKYGTSDYVGKGTHVQNLVTFRLMGASPHIGEI